MRYISKQDSTRRERCGFDGSSRCDKTEVASEPQKIAVRRLDGMPQWSLEEITQSTISESTYETKGLAISAFDLGRDS